MMIIGDNLAIVADAFEGGVRDKPYFFTSEKELLQAGFYSMSKGHKIKAHIHKGSKQEFLYIETGKLNVSIYNNSRELVEELTLEEKDSIWLGSGGHSFEALEDTVVVYCKIGPYEGREADKEVFDA